MALRTSGCMYSANAMPMLPITWKTSPSVTTDSLDNRGRSARYATSRPDPIDTTVGSQRVQWFEERRPLDRQQQHRHGAGEEEHRGVEHRHHPRRLAACAISAGGSVVTIPPASVRVGVVSVIAGSVSQVSGLGSHVSGLGTRDSGLGTRLAGLTPPVSG